jgi:hypothetical protein
MDVTLTLTNRVSTWQAIMTVEHGDERVLCAGERQQMKYLNVERMAVVAPIFRFKDAYLPAKA